MSRTVLLLTLATLAAAVLFTLWPGLDLAVSAPFRDPQTGRWMADAPAPAALRDLLWSGGQLAIAAFALLWLVALLRRGRARVPARLWGFALLSMALGPGVLANVILKDHWGRARPRMVAEFGGEALFTPALQVTDQCASNCSFVSGEVAMIATLAMVLWLLLSPGLGRAARRVLAAALLALTGVSALLRVAGGGHFLSDVLFAGLFCAMLTLALWRLTGAAAMVSRLSGRALRDDLAAPFAPLRK